MLQSDLAPRFRSRKNADKFTPYCTTLLTFFGRSLNASLHGRIILSPSTAAKLLPLIAGRAGPMRQMRRKDPMKRAYVVRLFLCLTTTFLFAQLHLPPSASQTARGVSRPPFRLRRALPLPHSEPFGWGSDLRHRPFSTWDKVAARSSQQNFGSGVVGAPSSPRNSILLAAPTYDPGSTRRCAACSGRS